MFPWNRPRPKFRVTNLLRFTDDVGSDRFMIVEHRRWIRPNHESDWRWVYDGSIVEPVGDQIVCPTYVSCVYEEDLTRVVWHASNRRLLDPRFASPKAA